MVPYSNWHVSVFCLARCAPPAERNGLDKQPDVVLSNAAIDRSREVHRVQRTWESGHLRTWRHVISLIHTVNSGQYSGQYSARVRWDSHLAVTYSRIIITVYWDLFSAQLEWWYFYSTIYRLPIALSYRPVSGALSVGRTISRTTQRWVTFRFATISLQFNILWSSSWSISTLVDFSLTFRRQMQEKTYEKSTSYK